VNLATDANRTTVLTGLTNARDCKSSPRIVPLPCLRRSTAQRRIVTVGTLQCALGCTPAYVCERVDYIDDLKEQDGAIMGAGL